MMFFNYITIKSYGMWRGRVLYNYKIYVLDCGYL